MAAGANGTGSFAVSGTSAAFVVAATVVLMVAALLWVRPTALPVRS
ncbi:hypothetical protein ABT336_22395 [Micromonospora sp. NPDC000207]